MKTAIPLLADVRVASPCHSSWNTMKGDEQTRYCGLCRKNVYNLSEMTRQEAENLIREKEGKLCVRYYQRADGTVLTKDCPIGVAVVRRVLLARAVSASALLVTVIALFGKNLLVSDTPLAITGAIMPPQSITVGEIEPVESPNPRITLDKIAIEPPVRDEAILGGLTYKGIPDPDEVRDDTLLEKLRRETQPRFEPMPPAGTLTPLKEP